MRPERRSHLIALATITVVGLAPLITPSVWAQQSRPRPGGQPASSRLGSGLRQLVAGLGPRPQAAPGSRARLGLSSRQMQWDVQGRVGISITAANPARLVRPLAALGIKVQALDNEHHVLEGFAPVSALVGVEALASQGLLGVSAIPRPITDAGTVNSQATFVLESDRVNATVPPGVTGAGVRVGIISDSYNRLGGAAAGVASGDLPAGGVNVVAEGPASDTIDEGRAMAELIHDVAPGAAIAFSTGAGGPASRALSIINLADPVQGNCGIIADDVFYLGEPFFQDSLASQAVDAVVGTYGTAYFCSAGNRARQAYESTSFNWGVSGDPDLTKPSYDFDPGAGVDTRMRVRVAANSSASISLQWDDPYFTVAGVDTDLDIYAEDDVDGVVSGSNDDNAVTQTPNELFTIENTDPAPHEYDLVIQHWSGPVPGRMKFVYHGALTILEFGTNSPTINSNAAATNAMAVGAVAYYAQDSAEQFTSAGPSTILFQPNGTPLGSPEVRSKPDIAAIDGTDTSFFGSDIDLNGLPNFSGTSAAAPHAAAVAALVKEQFPSMTPAQLYTRLKTLADASVNLPGVDDQTGAGLLNAYDAVFGLPTVATTPVSEGMESGALPLTFETHSTGAGRIQVSSSNGPATGVRHLLMDSSVPGLFSRNEVILHVNLAGLSGVTLQFNQREYNDADNPMPGTFVNASNSDGVAYSVDGVNWRRASSLVGGSSGNTYLFNSINLSASAGAAGVTLGADTRIKFQQYGNQSIGSGGFAFDNISVTSSSQPPVVQANKTVDVAEDSVNNPLSITAPTDPNGDPLTITVTNLPTAGKGSVHFAGGGAVTTGTITSAQLTGLQYDTVPNQNGAAGTFTYTVSDGTNIVSQTVTLNITAANDAPVAENDKTVTVAEDSGSTSLAIPAPTDVDGDPLTITVTAVPTAAKGKVRIGVGGTEVTTGMLSLANLSNLVFETATDASGAAGTFTYTVSDGAGGSDTQVVTLDITPVNDAPVAQDDKTVTVAEDSGSTALGITAPTDIDGGALTVTVTAVPNATKGTVHVGAGGALVTAGNLPLTDLPNLVFETAADANGAAGSFTYTVSDGAGGSDTQAVTINITAVNDAPVAQDDKPFTVAEDSGSTALGITTPTDADGDALTVTVTAVPTAAKGKVRVGVGGTEVTTGMLSLANLSNLVFETAADANGAAGTFTYTVDDGNGGMDTQVITIAITAVNDAPVAQDDKPFTVAEDSGSTALGITTPTDADGDPLTVTVTAVPTAAKGKVRVGVGGTEVTTGMLSLANLSNLVFETATDANGAAGTFAYTVDDGNGGMDTQVVTISITAVNDAPVAQGNKTVTVPEDDPGTSLNITAPTDAEMDSLTITVTAIPDPAKGEVIPGGGTAYAVGNMLTAAELTNLLFRPIANANGAAGTFAYTVDDGQGGTTSQTITLAITPVNDPPVAQGDKTVTVDENSANTPLAITAPTDVDADPLTIKVTSVPNTTKGDVVLSGSAVAVDQMLTVSDLTSLEFNPAMDQNGSAGTFTYTVADGQGGMTSQTITLEITPANRAPVVDANKTFTVLEDAANTNLGITAPSDPDGDALTITVNTIPTASKGVVRRAPADGGAAVAVGATLSAAQVAGLEFDPSSNQNGAAGTFSYTASDGKGGTASQTVTISITPVNDPPVVQANKTHTNFEDGLTLPLGITAPTDPDGDTLTITVTSVPDTAKGDVRLSVAAGGQVVVNGQSLSSAQLTGLRFDPASNANGAAGAFTYTVTDGHGGSATQVVTINLIPVNDFPNAQDAKTVTVVEDSPNTPLNITAPTDVDGDPLTITVTSVPNSARGDVRLAAADGGTVVTFGQTLTIPQLLGLEFDPALNATGFAGIFSYAATDPGFLSDVQLISLQITAVNDAPTVQGDKTVTVLEDSANTNLAITAPTDVEGDTLTITVTSVPTNGKGDVYLAGGATKVTNGQTLSSAQLAGLEFDPALNANGAAGVFSYSVSDGHGGTNGQTITINITPVNDDPVATGEMYSTYRGTPITVPAPGVLDNDSDIDGDPLSAVLVSDVTHGTLTLNANGSFTYTPVIAFFGAETFTYHASDGAAFSNTVTVTINVSENPPPADPDVQADASGNITAPVGVGTVAITVRRANGIIMGSLTYSENDRNRSVSSTKITSLVMGPGRAMRIFGKGKLTTGAVVDFVADINDVAEPGKNKDTFKLEISNGQTPQGTLTLGNIRINR